jgi:hypothetical protein
MTEGNGRSSKGRSGGMLPVVLGAALLLAPPQPAVAMALEVDTDQSRDASTAAIVGPFSFEIGPYELRTVPIAQLPYHAATIVAHCEPADASGVAMYRAADGTLHNHPVMQAACAINLMRDHWRTGDPSLLERSRLQAQRLLDTAVAHAGAIFFPYPFRWTNTGRNVMEPPWYSAMAQGQALSVFVRLFEWTGETKWRQAADATFASFRVPRRSGAPWVVGVENGLLWLDEYPTVPLDRVFNGHNFAMYGLYDYWRLTSNAEARLLALGAIHSSYVAAATVRDPGGISRYCISQACLDRGVKNAPYHITHIGQLRAIFHLTGHWHFASLAEAFTADSPVTTPGQARLAAGNHDGYVFDGSGVGTRATTMSLVAASSFAYSRRDVPGGTVRPGNGVWLRLSEGPLAGLWVRESSRAVPLGFVDDLDFWTDRTVRVAAGSYTGTTFASDGTPTGGASASTTGLTTWRYTRYARINGIPSVLLSSGPLTSHWLALDQRTLRDTTLFTDIDASIYRTDVIWLTTTGITRGCRTYQYCPSTTVTREQMASFLARALKLPATSRDFFGDDNDSAHQGDINRLAAAGITGGCAPNRFCPSASISRGQMAAFIHRAMTRAGTGSTFGADADSTGEEATPAPTAEPVPEPTPTVEPSPSASPEPTPTPSADPTPEPSPSASPEPTASPTPEPAEDTPSPAPPG